MSYTLLEHDGNARMRITGDNLEELFRDAMLGMASLTKPEPHGASVLTENRKRAIACEADDATELLLHFLRDVLAWMHAEGEAYTQVHFEHISPTSLVAEIVGYHADSFGALIREVSDEDASVECTSDSGWHTDIVFEM